MSNDRSWTRTYQEEEEEEISEDAIVEVREVHPLSSPQGTSRMRRRESWEGGRSSSLSVSSETENFTSMSREFTALVVAGSAVDAEHGSTGTGAVTDTTTNLGRIREEELLEETNPLAIVPDNNPIPSPHRTRIGPSTSSLPDNSSNSRTSQVEEVSIHRVKKEEVESKIAAWQTAEIAKINNRFKREDVIINGWESEQVEKATSWLKKVERKLDEQRARAVEKMQNDVAKARRKAEEKRASAEGKRGTKVAKVLELSTVMRAVGRAPSKRSFF